jgi:acetylornithine deacetylase/succinyl-diaminopimelate desuccinylase-like protein
MTEVPEVAGSVKRVATAPVMAHIVGMKLILLLFAVFASAAFGAVRELIKGCRLCPKEMAARRGRGRVSSERLSVSAGTPRQLLRTQTLWAKAAKSAEWRCRRAPRPAGHWLLDSALLGTFAAIATPFLISVQLLAQETPSAPASGDPDIAKMVTEISAGRIERSIHILTSFTTRHTLSDPSPNGNDIGAARAWIRAEFERISAASEGRLQVELDAFQQPRAPGIPQPVEIVNIVATLPGTQPESRDRIYIVSSHYDSCSSDLLNSESPAPGADDDASGVAAVLELARVMSHHQFNATIVFMAVAGEEQGCYGSARWAAQARQKELNIAGVINNDIIGSTRTVDGGHDSATVRIFAQGVPPGKKPGDELSALFSTGGENDTPARELARAVKEAAAIYMPAMNVKLIYRTDRYLCEGDQQPFLDQGYPAVRLTEPGEDFRHQRQEVRVENNVVYGDTTDLMNFAYIADVTRVNAAALAVLARAPAAPHGVQIETTRLENDTTLRWRPNPEPDLAGYRIVWRDTTEPLWDHARDVPKDVTRFTLHDVSKDNVIFGVEAVDAAGHASPAVYPLPAGRPEHFNH